MHYATHIGFQDPYCITGHIIIIILDPYYNMGRMEGQYGLQMFNSMLTKVTLTWTLTRVAVSPVDHASLTHLPTNRRRRMVTWSMSDLLPLSSTGGATTCAPFRPRTPVSIYWKQNYQYGRLNAIGQDKITDKIGQNRIRQYEIRQVVMDTIRQDRAEQDKRIR